MRLGEQAQGFARFCLKRVAVVIRINGVNWWALERASASALMSEVPMRAVSTLERAWPH